MFGFSDSEWEVLLSEMRDALADTARSGCVVTYGDLAARVSSGRFSARSRALYALLDAVCDEPAMHRGCSLGALVVRRDTGIPGEGYFAHLSMSGVDVAEPVSVWRGEVQRVWAAYRDDDGE